jgi:N6-adenosine-specific RNA methylase IME4
MTLPSSSGSRYATIVADPPWQTKTGPSWGRNDKSAPLNASSHDLAYPTMSLTEIAELPVGRLAEQDAHLYLWTTNGYVEAAYEIAREWGFRPSTLLTWCKPPKGIGLGGAFSLTAEFCIFARRGSLATQTRVDSSWWLWPRRRHSEKPEAFLDLVEQVSPGPYLEMFARRARFGWDYWGDQSLGTAEVADAA